MYDTRHQPLLFVEDDYRGDCYFRFTDESGIEHEVTFKPRHGRLLVTLINAWIADEGDHEKTRGCRRKEQLASLIPELLGDIAAIQEHTVETYVYSVRARSKEELDLTDAGKALAVAMIETVRLRGFRAGSLLRNTRIVHRAAPATAA